MAVAGDRGARPTHQPGQHKLSPVPPCGLGVYQVFMVKRSQEIRKPLGMYLKLSESARAYGDQSFCGNLMKSNAGRVRLVSH